MKISRLNQKILIQKTKIEIDKIGNHTNSWEDYFLISAEVNNESPLETSSAGNIWDESKIDFVIRNSSEVKEINSLEFRVIFNKNIYLIEGVDHMGYNNTKIKLHCRKAER